VLTETAAAKAKALLDQEGADNLRLRVQVQPGGCSGLRYQLFFDERDVEGDQIAEFGGVEVVVDRSAVPSGLIDFVAIGVWASPS
jgi:iron-sulfur cluster assembly accessory protein